MTPVRLVGWVLAGVILIVAATLILTPPEVGGYSCGSVMAPVQQPALAPFEVAVECNDLRAGRFLWALGVGLGGFALMVGLLVDRARTPAPAQVPKE